MIASAPRQQGPVVPERLVVGDAEGPRGKGVRKGLPGIVQQADRALADGSRIGAALRLGPDHPDSRSALHRGQPRRGRTRGVPGRGRQDRAGERLVEGAPVSKSLGELLAIRGQGPAGSRRALPGDLLVDVAPDRHVLSERAAHSLALDRAAAQGDHRRGPADLTGQGIEHGDDQPLLAAAELDLSLALEERRDRLAQLALEQLIGVDHPEIESLGDRLRPPASSPRP